MRGVKQESFFNTRPQIASYNHNWIKNRWIYSLILKCNFMKCTSAVFLAVMLVVACTAVLAGCIQTLVETKTAPQVVYVTVLVTPTPTTTIAPVKDPVIGVWRYSGTEGDARMRFNADGTLAVSSHTPGKGTDVYSGTWSAQGNNTYKLLDSPNGKPVTVMYDPVKNRLYNSGYPNIILTPYQGDLMTAS